MRRSWIALAMLILFTGTTRAQGGANHPQPANCHGLWTATLASGRPHGDLAACGAIILPDIVRAMDRMHSPVDTQFVRTVVGYASAYRDPTVYEAALRLVNAREASRPARMGGFIILTSQYRRNSVPRGDYQTTSQLLAGPVRFTCQWEASTSDHLVSRPLPPDYLARIRTSAERIVGTPEEDGVVKSYAACVTVLLDAVEPAKVDPSLIQLRYKCGLDFIVRNGSNRRLTLRFTVEGTDDGDEITANPHTEQLLPTFEVGTVRLYLSDELIATAQNRGTPCQ